MSKFFTLLVCLIVFILLYGVGSYLGLIRLVGMKLVRDHSKLRIYDNLTSNYRLEEVGAYKLPLKERDNVLSILLKVYPSHPVSMDKSLVLGKCTNKRIPFVLSKGLCWRFNTGDTMCGAYSDSGELVVLTGDIYITRYLNTCVFQ